MVAGEIGGGGRDLTDNKYISQNLVCIPLASCTNIQTHIQYSQQRFKIMSIVVIPGAPVYDYSAVANLSVYFVSCIHFSSHKI